MTREINDPVKLSNIKGLGTLWRFELEYQADSQQLESFITDQIELFEANFSRFRPNSLLSQYNSGRLSRSAIGSEFQSLLELGERFYDETEGVFNFRQGNELVKKGYGGVEGEVDFGGFGKGFLVDKIASLLIQEFRVAGMLINAGGDILTHGRDFDILLEHPQKDGYYIGSVSVKSQGFASSSPFKRTWVDKKTDKLVTHLISHKELKTASYVIAPNATEADFLATTLSLLGDDSNSIEKLNKSYDFEYLLHHGDRVELSDGFPLKRIRN